MTMNMTARCFGSVNDLLLGNLRKKLPLVTNKARYYDDACLIRGEEYYNYENRQIQFSFQDDFECVLKLGRGRYSEVFRGVNLITNEDVVVKILKPVRAKKIKREITVMSILSDSPDIIKLRDQVIDNSTRTPSIIMEYFEH